MSEEKETPATSSALETVVDDLVGVDYKFPRTLRDMLIRPGAVADAALAKDHSRYTRPLKVFLTVFAVQTLLSGWLGINDTGTFSVIFADEPVALAHVEARLAAAGSSLAEADDVVRQWTSWVSWPLIMITSLLYALVIWATRPRLGLLNSTLLYLVAAGASNTASIPVTLVGGLFGPTGLLWGTVISFGVLFVYAGLVLHRRAADSTLGWALRVLAFVLATFPVLLVVGVLVFGTIEVPFTANTGLSRLQLIAEASRAGQ
jgi:hypothetical protein